ncbi:MAG: TraB/GumN family protein, partial [Myxococcales bacterium]|nr:TraB/GumN family protein [Myxococcales bacterium]
TPPMDKVLAERARRAHKPLIFLEPAAHQLALLGKWMDLRALKMMLDELPAAEHRVGEMLAAYVAGDERVLLAINDGERAQALAHGYTEAEYAQEMNDLLYDRNAAWIPALERLHAEGGGFVAVGALHLIGPRSVLDLLARKGYQVTRLTP